MGQLGNFLDGKLKAVLPASQGNGTGTGNGTGMQLGKRNGDAARFG